MSYGVAGANVGPGNCGPVYPVAGASCGVGGVGTGIGIILVLFILLVIISRSWC
ncbi:sporulation protein YjcZ [Paenibacillus luteus]|uniref:sporulation protein YjcZ n=1 Tax=Paenibacillus luteus TaxID=2545753 RepID=UPI0011441CF1|nr:sporulation protein YjcZ [Paenibacillus luteus]